MEWIEEIYRDGGIEVCNTVRGRYAEGDNYGGLNVCHYVGDSTEHVAWSREMLCKALGIGRECLIVPRQTHSVNVKVIESLPAGALESVDALVTSLHGVAIGVSTADCVPVLLADEKAHIIGAAHAGWRGAVGGIVQRTVRAMGELGASASSMRAWLGPCICQNCFEVGQEVACQFPEEFVSRSGAKPHVDLPGYVISLLVQCGVDSSNIIAPRACTRCHPETYFSARRLGIASGRIFSAILQK